MTNIVPPLERLTDEDRLELIGILSGYNFINNRRIAEITAEDNGYPLLGQVLLENVTEVRDRVDYLLTKLKW